MRFKQTLLPSNKYHPINAKIAKSRNVKGTKWSCHTGETEQDNKVIFVTCDTSGRQSSPGVTGHRMSLDVHVVFNPLVPLWVTDHTRLEVMEIPSTEMIWKAGLGQAWPAALLWSSINQKHHVQLHYTWHKETRKVWDTVRKKTLLWLSINLFHRLLGRMKAFIFQ